MADGKDGEERAGISSATIKARTGKDWSGWFATLDQARAAELGHKGIVALLSGNARVGPWWRQTIAVAYEQERGLRKKQQTPEGFQISVSKMIAAPAGKVFDEWADPEARARWLRSPDFTVRRSTQDRSLRITWGDGRSSVDVNFYPRGPEKSQVVVDHRRLGGAEEVDRMKTFWSEALEELKKLSEGRDS